MQIALWYISKDEYVSLYIQRLFLLDSGQTSMGLSVRERAELRLKKRQIQGQV